MNQTINKVILVGYIADEPRSQIVNNKRVLLFTLITPEQIKRGDEVTLHQEHHHIHLDERSANTLVVQKNSVVYIQGKIHTQQILGSDNIKRYYTEVIANNIELVGASFPKDAV